MKRYFIALPIPDCVTLCLGALQNELRPLLANSIRWVRSDHMHLTLQFLGRLDDQVVTQLESLLASCARERFYLAFEKLDVFGYKRPTVLFVRTTYPQSLAQLIACVHENTRHLIDSQKPFIPHITLGRFCDNVASDQEFRTLKIDCKLSR